MSHFRLGVGVTSIQRQNLPDDSYMWCLTLDNGENVDFHNVFVCTGLYGNPDMPEFPNQDEFAGKIFHSKEVTHASLVEGKHVLVLGCGRSAIDVALNIKRNGAKSTDIVFRTAHWFVPHKIANLVPYDWAIYSRFGALLLHPYHQPSLAAKLLHDFGWLLKWAILRLVEFIVATQQGLSKLGMKPTTPLEIDAFGPGALENNPSFFQAAIAGEIQVHSNNQIEQFTNTGVTLRNNENLKADVVVLATGYKPADFQAIFPKENLQRENDGIYLYRHVICPSIPGVFFIGALSDTYSNITMDAIQSRWACEVLKKNVHLPTCIEMEKEVNRVKKWKRSWMPFTRYRGGHLQLHQVHYYDELIMDFNGRWNRKSNHISELFAPYHPFDYSSIVDYSEK